MITETAPVLDVQSTVSGERTDMSIDAAAMGHIMSILTDLYSDPELAVIREYSTNALDAHIEAGNIDPIEVYTPTPLSPFFRVKDYGVGLNPQDIQEIYSKYGASTKRNTNDQVGMLGLGCKSALTYATQFTLTGVKDGVKTRVSVARESDGSGSMTVVDTTTTDEPNGVEILVPAKRDNSFESKAKDFFSYWEPGTVKLNGADPVPVECIKLTDDIYIQDVHNAPYDLDLRDQLVMGNVAYPTLQPLSGLGYRYRIIARVPIGSLDIHPSREALRDTAKTTATLESVRSSCNSAMPGLIQRLMDESSSHLDALKTYTKWRNILPPAAHNSHFHYQGDRLPDALRRPKGDMITLPSWSRPLNSSSRAAAIPAESWPNTLWIVGYDTTSKWSAPRRRKLNKYCADNVIEEVSTFVLINDDPHDDLKPWVSLDRIVPWSDINAVKLDCTTTSSGRPSGSYPSVYTQDGHQGYMSADQFDTSGEILYRTTTHDPTHTRTLALKYDKYTVVAVSTSRLSKFKRIFPNARLAADVAREILKEQITDLTETERAALTVFDHGVSQYYTVSSVNPSGTWRTLRRLDKTKIDDPDVVSACQLTETDLTNVLKARKLCYEHQRTDLIERGDPNWENPLSKYPLMNTTHLEHTYLYMNAVYAAERGDQ